MLLNIFNILCFVYKCKQNCISQYFYPQSKKQIYAPRNENSIQEPLYRTNFSQYCISYCGPYCEPYLGPYRGPKLVISKNLTFSDNDCLQAFKRELKRFLLSVELNDLEIL